MFLAGKPQRSGQKKKQILKTRSELIGSNTTSQTLGTLYKIARGAAASCGGFSLEIIVAFLNMNK